MSLSGAGGMLETEYRHPMAGERHSLRLHVAHFDPSPFTSSYGAYDRAYVAGGPVTPGETSILATWAALAALWAPYFSPHWSLSLMGLRLLSGGALTALTPLPGASSVAGANTADDDAGPRQIRRIRLLGRTGAVRHLWISQVPGTVELQSPIEVTPSSGGVDSRDQAWMAYLSGASGGGAVMPDGTYCFPVTDMRTEWARQLEEIGVDRSGMLSADCLTFPHGQGICGDVTATLRFLMGNGPEHRMDDTGYTLPGGHRLETVPG